ncbi:MAG: GTP-binding protein [Pirellulales bacterium]
MSDAKLTESKLAESKPTDLSRDEHYRHAMASVEQTLSRMQRCSEAEKEHLRRDLGHLQEMLQKLTQGRVEIVVFGEISTGKSALINALVGQAVTSVDVRGGWTKEVWHVPWNGAGYCIPGLANSQLVLVDTPGVNEVGGVDRATMAREVAQRSDLILFVTDSDLNETEYAALLELAKAHKPMLVVLNKADLYTREQRERLLYVLREERLAGIVAPDDVVTTTADPRAVEYLIETPTGGARSEWRKPAPDIEQLKQRILEMLDRDGLALLALNGALYASDKSDRIAMLRVQLREQHANVAIWSYAALKALAVAFNPIPVVDILGGSAVDATMVATLAHIYGLEISWVTARGLAATILKAAGWVLAGEIATHWAASTFKALVPIYGTLFTAIPQGAASGYGSFIVGQAAKYYFEHGASWGPEGPKQVVQRILDQTDKQSVLARLKDEIRKKIQGNAHSAP